MLMLMVKYADLHSNHERWPDLVASSCTEDISTNASYDPIYAIMPRSLNSNSVAGTSYPFLAVLLNTIITLLKTRGYRERHFFFYLCEDSLLFVRRLNENVKLSLFR